MNFFLSKFFFEMPNKFLFSFLLQRLIFFCFVFFSTWIFFWYLPKFVPVNFKRLTQRERQRERDKRSIHLFYITLVWSLNKYGQRLTMNGWMDTEMVRFIFLRIIIIITGPIQLIIIIITTTKRSNNLFFFLNKKNLLNTLNFTTWNSLF